uniref:CCHC-type domain-containing protein n=1 Tax=Gopherus agassizii TaxID=38772 RepID=A0A452GHJ5_9SAUR
MYAKRRKCDLLELCKQRGLRPGRLTKDQLIAQLEQGDRMNERSPVSEGSSRADASQAPVSVPAGSGQPADEGFPRPPLPRRRGRAGRSPVYTEGTVTPPASRGASRRSSPPSRGSSRQRSASVERTRLEYERELRREELELKRRELEEKAKQREHEENQRKHEENQRKHEENQRQREREEKEKQRKHELELARLASSEAPAAVSEGGPKPTKSFDKHLLPRRKEGEDIDTFLTAFENACELHRVDPADRIAVLTPLLDSTAVEVYSRLKGAEAGDYELFKQALLREFGLTPEMYRKKFRSQRKTREVTYLQLVNRAQGYARKWTAGAQTKEDLLDLFILEHLYEQCPSDLRLWLMDQKPENPQHAGQLADQFVDSRAGDGREESRRSRPASTQRESHHGTSQRGPMENPPKRGTSSGRSLRPTQGDPRDMGCYRCGQRGHIRAQCPKLRDRPSRPNPQRVDWVKTQSEEGLC